MSPSVASAASLAATAGEALGVVGRGVTAPRVIFGGGRSLDALVDLANGARRSLRGEVFIFVDPPVTAAVGNAWRRGLRGSALATPHSTMPSMIGPAIDDTRATLGYYGNAEVVPKPLQFVHSKAFVADASKAWVSSAVMIPDTRTRMDFAVEFGGASARRLAGLIDAAVGGDVARMREAARRAAASGVLVNDPVAGVATLTRQYEAIVDGATTSLTIATKEFRDVAFAERVAAAARRGVKTRVIANVASDEATLILHDAGVRVLRGRGYVHGTLITNGETAALGSAYLGARSLMRPSIHAGVQSSREVGAAITDPAALREIDAGLAAIKTHSESGLGGIVDTIRGVLNVLFNPNP